MGVILRQAIRNLLVSKLRLTLTSLAIVLVVGFVVGAFVLGDTINKAFDSVVAAANEGVSVQVRGVETVSELDRQPVPESALGAVPGVPGVKSAQGEVFGTAQIIGRDGTPAGVQGPPTLGFGWSGDPELNPLSVTSGAPPRAPDEVVIDRTTAEDEGFAIGDRVRIVTAAGSQEYRLVGIVAFGDQNSLAGATLAAFTLPTAQFRQFVDIFRNFLLAFAFVSLFVGAFIIFNAFKITVAQRTRQLGLLRAVGASTGQVVRSVMLEALFVGIAASVVGILFGIAFAALLRAGFNAIGAALPPTGLQIEPRSVIAGLVVGLFVTLVAALVPAWRASRVPPIAAMRDVQVAGSPRARLAVSAGLSAAGVALVLTGMRAPLDGLAQRFGLIGLGAVLLFIGAAMLTQYVARPLARLIGAPMAWTGVAVGRLHPAPALLQDRHGAVPRRGDLHGQQLRAVLHLPGPVRGELHDPAGLDGPGPRPRGRVARAGEGRGRARPEGLPEPRRPDEGRVQGLHREPVRPLPAALLRPAGDGRDHRDLRHHPDPGAVGLRAHPRDRAAARRRPVAAQCAR